MQAKELTEVIELAYKKDRVELGLTSQDPDPWVKGNLIYFRPDGSVYGSALCIRAWLHVLLGYIEHSFPRSYDLVRLLRFVPSGLVSVFASHAAGS